MEKAKNTLAPTIYQVRFENRKSIEFEKYPELKDLGKWLSTFSNIWGCHSNLAINDFNKKFLEITGLFQKEV